MSYVRAIDNKVAPDAIRELRFLFVLTELSSACPKTAPVLSSEHETNFTMLPHVCSVVSSGCDRLQLNSNSIYYFKRNIIGSGRLIIIYKFLLCYFLLSPFV